MPIAIELTAQLYGCTKNPNDFYGSQLLIENLKGWSPPYGLLSRNPTIITSTFSDLFDVRSCPTATSFGNGFVIGFINAFRQGLHLRLRPDDVWLAILTQLRIYCDVFPEAVPGVDWVQHIGRPPVVRPMSNPIDSTMDVLNQKVASLINHSTMHSSFKDWVKPCFSTTTDNDKAVASVVTLGEIQKRTNQSCWDTSARSGSGLGGITLLGTPKDWNIILCRISELSDFSTIVTDAAITMWIKQLTEVLRGITTSFSLPNEQETKDFWARACLFDGIDYSFLFAPEDKETMTGWITAFCFWSWGGCLNANYIDAVSRNARFRDHGREFFREDGPYATQFSALQKLVLYGVEYHHIFPSSIPNAVACLPIELFDDSLSVEEFDVTVVAGSVGAIVFEVDKAEPEAESGEVAFMQPRSGWWMLREEDQVIELGSRMVNLGVDND